MNYHEAILVLVTVQINTPKSYRVLVKKTDKLTLPTQTVCNQDTALDTINNLLKEITGLDPSWVNPTLCGFYDKQERTMIGVAFLCLIPEIIEIKHNDYELVELFSNKEWFGDHEQILLDAMRKI